MKSFETWTLEELQNSFGLKQLENSEVLNNWISSTKEINENDKTQLEKYRISIKKYINTWNEDELKMHFIGPLLMLVDFTTENYKSFTQRTIKTKINDIEVGGKVDFMVATGLNKPKTPFFFLHEYKPARKATNDPDGQLLIAMLAAQNENKNNKPIYGVVVEGRFWYFVVLNENKYILSKPFDACEEDIYKIYAILCKVKDYIDEFIGIRN